MIAQGKELARLIARSQLVVQTTVLEQTMDDWGIVGQRQFRDLHQGVIWISSSNLALSRLAPLPPT